MKRLITSLAVLSLASLPLCANAQVDFSQVAISEPLTVAEVESALSVTGTSAIDGLALGPTGTIFIVHRDTATAQETFAQVDPLAVTPTALFTASPANYILEGEVTFDPSAGASGTLYFADSSVASPDNYRVIALDVDTGSASTVLDSNTIAGWSSHGVLPDGQLIGALGEDFEVLTGGEPQVVLLDPSAGVPAASTIFDVDDFSAESGVLGELPPETIGVDPTTGSAYVFCHDNFEIFRIDDAATSPVLNHVVVPGWTDDVNLANRVDLHGLAVDEDGNLYGFDEAAEAIVVYDGTSNYSVPFSDIETALGGPTFGVSVWRGMKARKISSTQSEVLLASSSADYGVVRIVFGGTMTNVESWNNY